MTGVTCTCDTSCPLTSLSILVRVSLEIAFISQCTYRLFSGHLKTIIEPTMMGWWWWSRYSTSLRKDSFIASLISMISLLTCHTWISQHWTTGVMGAENGNVDILLKITHFQLKWWFITLITSRSYFLSIQCDFNEKSCVFLEKLRTFWALCSCILYIIYLNLVTVTEKKVK